MGATTRGHRNGAAAAIDGAAWIFHVDAVKRGGEAVGVAFAPLLAIGDDVEPGAFLIVNGDDGGVVLRRFELVGRDQPEIVRAHARHLLRQLGAVDQPFGLRVGTDKRGG